MVQRPRLLKSDTLVQSLGVAMILAMVGRLFAFARGVLFARAMDPAELGTWALLINAVQVLAFVCLLGIPSGLSRYIERYRRQGRLGAMLWKLGAVMLVAAGLLCAAGMWWHGPIGRLLFGEASTPALVGLTLGAVFAMAVFLGVKGILHGLRLFRLDSWLELIQNVAFFAVAGGLFLVWRRDAMTNAWAFVAVTLVTAAVMGVYLFRAVPRMEAAEPPPERSNVLAWQTLMIYSLAVWGAGSLQGLWRYLDRYMLLHLSRQSPEEVLAQLGDYFIATKLAQPLTVAAGLLGVILLPHAARLWEENRRDEVGRMIRLAAKLTGLGLTLAGAVLVVLRRPALLLVVGRRVEGAEAVIAPVVVTVIALALLYVLRTYLLCGERVWINSGVWCLALGANAGLNAWLIPNYGLWGASMATAASAALAVFATGWISLRDGLALDAGTWTACLLPGALLLPVPAVLASAVLVAALLLWTNWILTRDEKHLIDTWAADRWPAVLPRLRRPAAPDAAASGGA